MAVGSYGNCFVSSGRFPSSTRTKLDFTLHPSATLPRISLPVSSQNYEDMKYDQDMKIGRITHKDNQDTSTTRRLKSTEILLSPPRPVSTSTRPKTNQPQCDRRVARKPYQLTTTSSTRPNSPGSTTRCTRAWVSSSSSPKIYTRRRSSMKPRSTVCWNL